MKTRLNRVLKRQKLVLGVSGSRARRGFLLPWVVTTPPAFTVLMRLAQRSRRNSPVIRFWTTVPSLLLALVLSTGCMAVLGRSTYASNEAAMYRGVAEASHVLGDEYDSWIAGVALRTAVVVDLPLTAMVDTLLFPLEFLIWLEKAAIEHVLRQQRDPRI